MTKRMLIDATHHEETRVVVMEGNRLVEFDYESKVRRQLKGNIFLAKVTRVEPSLQAAFVNFGGNRHGFLPFAEIHPDYYRIPVADREALMAEQRALEEAAAAREAEEDAHEDEHTGEESDFVDAPETLDITADTDDEDTHEQGEAAQELVAEEAGYVHEDVDLTPHAGAHDHGHDHDHEHAHDADDADDTEDTDDAEDDGTEGNEGDESPDTEAEGSDTVEGPDAEGREGAQRGGRDGRRSWRRGRDGRRGGGRRYMGARNRNRDEIADDSVAALHARFRRKYKIQEVIKRGQIMLIQVSKEERGNKGAAVTTYLSLPGRYCVLMPNSPRGGGVSRKIGNFADRRRLKEMLSSLEIPSGMSVILRTAGVERSQPEIQRDFDYLTRLWDNIRELTLKSVAPAQIYEEGDLIKRAIRDIYSSNVDEVLVSGRDGYEEARGFMNLLMPDHMDKVALYEDEKIPLFQRYQIENQINEIGEPVVQLKSGGYLVINQTEALVAVDVNSGRATKERHIEETALKTNLEAAEEVARQLRLRDLGGLVVIDFIDMEDRRNNAKVERRLKDALSSDRARIQVSRISTFGLLELSRQRLNPSLTEAQFEKCPHCHGFGWVRSVDSATISALRALEEEGVRARTNRVTLHVPNRLALYILNEKREMLATIERRYGFEVNIHIDESLAPSDYTVEAMKMPSEDDVEAEDTSEEGDENTARAPRRDRAERNDRNDRNDRGGRDHNRRGPRNRPATMSESYGEMEAEQQQGISPVPAEDDAQAEMNEASGNVREADMPDDDSDNVFNRSDVEPDGRGARAPRDRGDRGPRGGRNRNRGGRNRNRGDRGPRPEGMTGEGGEQPREPRDQNNGRSPRGPRRDRGPRTERPQSSDNNGEGARAPHSAPTDYNAPSAPTGGGDSQPRYFVAKRRESAPAANAAPVESAPAPSGEGNGESGAKKRGWWSKFS